MCSGGSKRFQTRTLASISLGWSLNTEAISFAKGSVKKKKVDAQGEERSILYSKKRIAWSCCSYAVLCLEITKAASSEAM